MDTLTDRNAMQKNGEKVKKSNERLIISGSYFEHKIYEKPFFWNFRALTRATEKSFSREELLCKTKQDFESIQHSPDGSDNVTARREDSIWRSRQQIMQLVQANEGVYGERLKFVTYTFSEEVTDLRVARDSWAEYIRQVRGFYPRIKYLGVAEIQKKRYAKTGKKVWHFHVLFFNLPFLYGAKDFHSRLWGKGFIKIITLDHVKNVGLYVSKYLRKDLQEVELMGEKSYFTAKGLRKPIQWRQSKNVEVALRGKKFVVLSESQFDSKNYGVIKIKQLKIL